MKPDRATYNEMRDALFEAVTGHPVGARSGECPDHRNEHKGDEAEFDRCGRLQVVRHLRAWIAGTQERDEP